MRASVQFWLLLPDGGMAFLGGLKDARSDVPMLRTTVATISTASASLLAIGADALVCEREGDEER